MKTKKLLSLILSVIMIMSVIPMYASAAEKLTATANVQSWPTLSYKTADGKMYYGQTLEEALQINDDEVVLNAVGEQVAGHFEFRNPEKIPNPGTELKLDINFVPDDANAYTSFSKLRSTLVYDVQAVELVPVDENSATPIATAIEAGSLLSTSILSGGEMTNPYNPNEPKLISTEWIWSPSINEPSRTIVSESGYYTAQFAPAGYTPLFAQVYVEVLADFEVTEYPTIPEFTYDANITWADITLSGGKAVSRATGEEVDGVFTISEDIINNIPSSRDTSVAVVFTPANEEDGKAYNFSIPVTVNRIPISFGPDFKGTSIDDPYVLEVEPNADMGMVRDELKNYHLNWPGSTAVQIEDVWGTAENGRIYEFIVSPYNNSNYTGNIAYVKLVFKDVEFAVSSASYVASGEEIYVRFNSNKPNGTFDVYVDGKLIGDDVKRANDLIKVPYAPETSGTHTVKVVYNPTENDYYFMADYETEIQANVRRYITLKNMNSSQEISVNGEEDYPSSAYIKYGDEISINYIFENFVAWVITDASGKAVTLDGVDLTSNEISFTMPDHDLVITLKTTLDEETPDDGTDDGTGDDANNGIFGGIWSFFQKLINWFMNMIKQMMSLFGLGA